MRDRKGSEIGAHILSGAVMYPRALESFPGTGKPSAPAQDPVRRTGSCFLTRSARSLVRVFSCPRMLQEPRQLRRQPRTLRWLGRQPNGGASRSTPACRPGSALRRQRLRSRSPPTGDMGVGRDGKPTDSVISWGSSCAANTSFFARGCRGHLGRQLTERYRLGANSDPQAYGIGLKELWRSSRKKHPGRTPSFTRPAGPLARTPTRSFLYPWRTSRVVGFVVASHAKPLPRSYEEFQRYKTHRTSVVPRRRQAHRVGARAIAAGA